MHPVELRGTRLVLNAPTSADIPAVTEYCQDPIFEHVMTLPWPYHRGDAQYFVEEHVPLGWANDTEYTWALRLSADGPLLGAIGFRVASSDLGYWLGAPHRGHRLMPEAVALVVDWVFGRGVERIGWECVVGNTASLSVARASGFTFVGEAPAGVPARDGSRPPAWHGLLAAGDSRDPKPGWPA
jgi:RimJ/RimL family protein N-acetyltransferase